MTRFQVAFAFPIFIFLYGGCSQVHKEYGAKVKKKGAVTSDVNITYRSYDRVRMEFGLVSATEDDTLLKRVPKGGIIDFSIPYTPKDRGRYLHLTYIVKSPDGKEIRRRTGQNNGKGITRVYPSPQGNIYEETFYDSVHINQKITGPFEVIILETGERAKKIQKYKVIPDYKKSTEGN